MNVAVVGGGIVGLFAARYLEQDGADVTVYDPGGPGAGSVHAAGIIEPSTAYRTNTFAFLRRVHRLWRNGVCRFRGADPRWTVESLLHLERAPLPGSDERMAELGSSSMAEYRGLAQTRNDFDFHEGGLVETFDDPRHFAEERDLALARRATVPVDVRPGRGAGSLFFPEVGWLHTERFVERIVRELPRTRWVRRAVDRVALDGTLVSAGATERFDAVVVASGTNCRRLGVPLTGVRGYGWHARTRRAVPQATIFVDRGVAVVPFADEAKVTGGWDFDLGEDPARSAAVLRAIRRVAEVDELLDFKQGSRPCTPDGLPTVGRQGQLVVATGGFRLGWSFAPSLGRHAARLAVGQEANERFLARFCGSLRGGSLA
jgi:D-proline dehydrogenase